MGLGDFRAFGGCLPFSVSSSGSHCASHGWGRATAAGFSAYPNPSAGRLTLQLPTNLQPEAQLRLLDLSGRVLRRLPVPATRQLDLRDLPAGTYTLLLEQPGRPSLARRVVRE
jgi:hypothetical protein